MNVEGWKEKKLRDIAIINYGKSPATILSPEGVYPVVGTGGAERLGTNYLYDGDSIILGRKGSIDRVYFATGKFWTIDTAYYLSEFNEAFPKWLFYFLQTVDLRGMNEATGVPSLSRNFLYAIEILTPPVEEQEQISIILSTIDRAIEQTEAIIAKQQRIKTGLMQDLLTKGIDENGNIRSEETHEFKDSAIGRIPVEWELEEFGNRVKESAFGPRFSSNLYSDRGNFALLRTTDLDVDGNIIYTQMPLAKLPESEFNKHILQSEDLLITRSGTCGLTAMFTNYGTPTIPGAFSIRFRLIKNLALPLYIKIYFNWEVGRKRLLDLAEGGVQKNLRGSAINQMLFAFPDIEEQKRMVEGLMFIQSLIDLDREKLEKLKHIKTGLMQDLLTGKVRVTPLLEGAGDTTR